MFLQLVVGEEKALPGGVVLLTLIYCTVSSFSVEVSPFPSPSLSSRDGRGSYFFHGAGQGGERQGKKSSGRGGEPPLPHNAGRGGEGVKICGVGRGRGGEHTACIS